MDDVQTQPSCVRLRVVFWISLICLVIGIVLRVYRITDNDFIFYDEGYYLNYNRPVMEMIARHPAGSLQELGQQIAAFLRVSLAGAKALWFLIINLRVFFNGLEDWFFPRVVSAMCGVLTLALTYRFGRRFYGSAETGWLAAAVLALLPSHVFYSRLAIQEAFSTLMVLTGFWLYLFPRRFQLRTVLSGIAFAAAFFSNYRLIVLPVLIVFTEIFLSLAEGRKPDARHVVWCILTFFSCIFLIGGLDGGKHTVITFGWMFHQANLAKKVFHAVNFLSFPYYLFRLESWIFGILFFGNLYFVIKKQWVRAFPFFLVCLHMLMFSFAGEKGARYLCVMTPFMSAAVAALVLRLWDLRSRAVRLGLTGMLAAMFFFVTAKDIILAESKTDYRTSAAYLLALDPHVRFLSTQKYVHNLYPPHEDQVSECPHRVTSLLQYYAQGYRYLVIGPQSYVSWTDDEYRFTPRLAGYLDFVTRSVPPARVFPHMNDVLLERFVFDHNENLLQSIRFLELARQNHLGELRVYDLRTVAPLLSRIIQQQH